MSTSTPVNTKAVTDRRNLRFSSLEEIRRDVDAIAEAHQAGTLRTTGNWSPGQILQHCAKFMRLSMDGFPPGGPPWIFRVIAKLLFKKKATRGEPMPPGIKLPKGASFLLPEDGVAFETGLADMQNIFKRLDDGEKFTKPSPLFGPLTHEQWSALHCGHCSLHFSFLHPT